MLDVGESRSLRLGHYMLQHGFPNDEHVMENWKVEVSGFPVCQLIQTHTFTDLYPPLSTLETQPQGIKHRQAGLVACAGSSLYG
jgi:hypothetical protein